MPNPTAGRWNGNYGAGRAFYFAAPRERIYSGAVLAAVQDICFSVCVRVDARDAAAFPLRPTDGVRVEIAAAAVDRERDRQQLRDSGEDDMVGCEMTAPLAGFFVLAARAVVGAISLILQKQPIHSALSLIVVMIALAGLYLLLGAEFVAAVQIIVY